MSRIMFRFWLDDNKEDENALIGEVGDLKANRKFTETIRQGISLISDLRNGSLKVLFELFPYVKAEFVEYMQSFNNAETTQIDDERQQLVAYRAELDAYRQELEDRHQELEKERKATAEKQSAHVQKQLDRIENFLISQGNVPIKINDIADKPPQIKPIGSGLQPLGSKGGITQLNVAQVEKPNFDDDDIELEVSKAKGDGSAATNFLNSMMRLQESTNTS